MKMDRRQKMDQKLHEINFVAWCGNKHVILMNWKEQHNICFAVFENGFAYIYQKFVKGNDLHRDNFKPSFE